jgi:RimJ/RimL family protein N-acetyltransferase
LRQIDYPRSARLGITIAAAFTRRGYGQNALCVFLDHYFGDLGFEEMKLDVSGANLPARYLYQKLGFERLYSFWLSASYSQDEMLLQGEWVRRHLRNGKEQYFEMRLRANGWWRVRDSLL